MMMWKIESVVAMVNILHFLSELWQSPFLHNMQTLPLTKQIGLYKNEGLYWGIDDLTLSMSLFGIRLMQWPLSDESKHIPLRSQPVKFVHHLLLVCLKLQHLSPWSSLWLSLLWLDKQDGHGELWWNVVDFIIKANKSREYIDTFRLLFGREGIVSPNLITVSIWALFSLKKHILVLWMST